MIVTDQEMDELLKNCDVEGIKAASQRDPHLIQRGWRDGISPWVMRACLIGPYKVTVPLLIELGADIDAGQRDLPVENALAGAIVDSNVEQTKFLLELGANPRIKPQLVWGAVVSRKNQFELVKLLDQYGADIHFVDQGGFSGRYANPLRAYPKTPERLNVM